MRNRTLPGRHITDCQMRLYMSFRHTEPPVIAAAKAGFSIASATIEAEGLCSTCRTAAVERARVD